MLSTSGLDASIALSVMQVLRDIAATGRTVIGEQIARVSGNHAEVVATIHQPRSDIWQLADNVTLLAKGGLIAVGYPSSSQSLAHIQFTGHRSEAIPYFSSIGHPMPSEFFNPADHLLDLVSVDPRASQYDSSFERVNGLTSQWRTRRSKESGEEHMTSSDTVKRGEGTTSMKIAFPVVLERTWKNLWRKKDVSPPHWTRLTTGILQSIVTTPYPWWAVHPVLPAPEPGSFRYVCLTTRYLKLTARCTRPNWCYHRIDYRHTFCRFTERRCYFPW